MPLLHFEHPYLLLLLPPVFYALKRMMKHTAGYRRALFLLTRTLTASLLIAALASPFIYTEQTVSVEKPSILILVDNTPSMKIFDSTAAGKLYSSLKEKTIVDIRYLNTTTSPLGDAIIESIQPQQSILLISDGQNNQGSELGDAIALAGALNSTVYNLKPSLAAEDISVQIEAPSKLITGQKATALIRLNTLGNAEGRLEVWLDGKPVTLQQLSPEVFQLTLNLQQTGSHTLKAQVTPMGEDFYPQNNRFYRTLHVLPKPEILLVTRESSPLQGILETLYTLTTTSTLPSELEAYSAVVLDDMPAGELTSPQIDALSEYAAEGGGVIFLGGFNSFEYGGYTDASELKNLLPVSIGGGAPKTKNTGILILLDISNSTGSKIKGDSKLSVEKALAIQLLENISFKDYIGVISFHSSAQIIVPFERGANRNESIDRVARLTPGGSTSMLPALKRAEEILENFHGTANIIIISDGALTNEAEEEIVIGRIERLFKERGITTYTLGVGEDTRDEFMTQVATAGRGLYFKRDEAGSVKLLFGEKEEKREHQDFLLTPLTTSHFITTSLQLQNATITGYNNVVPRTNAQTLIMTDNGKPIITVMRYGLGRIIAFTTDNGNRWASKLYTRDNSQLISRTLNWAIGNPERNQPIQIQAPDAYQHQSITINIRTTTTPQATFDGNPLTLNQIDRNLYTATLQAEAGFHTIKANNQPYIIAVNPPIEYSRIGYNEELTALTGNNGGKTYSTLDEAESHLIGDLREKQTRIERGKKHLPIPFILAALTLFTFEVIIRRISEILRLRRQARIPAQPRRPLHSEGEKQEANTH
jgi:hypothetical protein